MDNSYFTKEETLAQHEAMTSTISAEIQGVQSAMNVQISGLATKEQADEILKVFKAVSMAIKVTETGGRWTYRALLALASLFVAMAVIITLIKGGFNAVFSQFYP